MSNKFGMNYGTYLQHCLASQTALGTPPHRRRIAELRTKEDFEILDAHRNSQTALPSKSLLHPLSQDPVRVWKQRRVLGVLRTHKKGKNLGPLPHAALTPLS